jgi:hypothetical protein
MHIGGLSPGQKSNVVVKVTIHVHFLPLLRMNGVVSPFYPIIYGMVLTCSAFSITGETEQFTLFLIVGTEL